MKLLAIKAEKLECVFFLFFFFLNSALRLSTFFLGG